MLIKISLFCISLLYVAHISDAYKVLVVFPLPGKSHSFLGAGIARHLVEAGHEVTFITPFPSSKQQNPLLREIDVSSMDNWLQNTKDMINIGKLMNKEVDLEDITTLISMFLQAHVNMFENENVRKLFNDQKEQFDVVIAEWMFNEFGSGISAIFNCPFIWVSSVDPHWMVLKLIDEIPNPAYSGDATSSGIIPFPFTQRVQELLKVTLGLTYQYFSVASKEHKEYERLIVPIIRKRGLKVPDFEELRYNASLILGNSHVSMGSAIRLPQNYKAVGGYHIDSNVEPLPEDLKRLLDNSKNGLIYFSMGSNLQSQHLPDVIKENLLKVFGRLKQTVLWKFEEDLPNRPSNVHIVQWSPQHSILAHPNCVLFITHGGLLSTTEAIHFGKPIIGIPVFGDQFTNVDKVVHRGFAKRVDLTYEMPNELEKAIHDILDPSYAAKAKELSVIYHDRPVPPGKELVHWVEHVVRTGGAPHLRSPALHVPWYQKFYLDLAIFIYLVVSIVKFIVKKLISVVFKKNVRKQKRH